MSGATLTCLRTGTEPGPNLSVDGNYERSPLSIAAGEILKFLNVAIRIAHITSFSINELQATMGQYPQTSF